MHWSPADAKKWMQENTEFVHLAEGDLYFVPYGTSCWTIGLDPSKASISIWMPLMCPQLFENLDKVTKESISQVIDEFMSLAGNQEPWSTVKEPLKRWVGAQS